jgi:hypothetical protein
MAGLFDDAIAHHLTIERFVAIDIQTYRDEHWRIARIHVDRDDCSRVELMFRAGGDSLENSFQLWLGDALRMSDGIVDGIVQIRRDARVLRIALDSKQGAHLELLSNLLVFEWPSAPQAYAQLENLLRWAHDQHRWDIRLSSHRCRNLRKTYEWAAIAKASSNNAAAVTSAPAEKRIVAGDEFQTRSCVAALATRGITQVLAAFVSGGIRIAQWRIACR